MADKILDIILSILLLKPIMNYSYCILLVSLRFKNQNKYL